MANRVKSVSKYSGSAWGTEVPIGADATNVDMTTAPSDYDSSSSETSKVLIGTNDVKVIASDTDLTAWGKFNRFRRRVSNKFADYFATANLTGSSTGVTSSGDDSHAYTTAALNNYFANVIGYSSAADVASVGKVSQQLNTLNTAVGDWHNTQPTSHIESFTYDGSSSTQTFTDSSGYTWTYTKSSRILSRNDTNCTITAISDSGSGSWTVATGGASATRSAAISSATTFTVTYTTATDAYDISRNLNSLNNKTLFQFLSLNRGGGFSNGNSTTISIDAFNIIGYIMTNGAPITHVSTGIIPKDFLIGHSNKDIFFRGGSYYSNGIGSGLCLSVKYNSSTGIVNIKAENANVNGASTNITCYAYIIA